MPILTIPSEICALAVGATMLAVARVAISASRNRTALTLIGNLASARRVSSHLIRYKPPGARQPQVGVIVGVTHCNPAPSEIGFGIETLVSNWLQNSQFLFAWRNPEEGRYGATLARAARGDRDRETGRA